MIIQPQLAKDSTLLSTRYNSKSLRKMDFVMAENSRHHVLCTFMTGLIHTLNPQRMHVFCSMGYPDNKSILSLLFYNKWNMLGQRS